MWVHAELAWIDEGVIAPSLDVADAAVRRAARARRIEDGDFVCELVADQRLQRVEEVRDVHLGGRDARGYELAVCVDGLDDQQVVRDVHAGLFETTNRVDPG